MLAQRDVWPDRIRRLKRVEYDRLVDAGLLQDSHVELLLGALVDMSPQGPRHAEVVSRIAERLSRDLTPAQRVRVQSPLALSDDSEPEPDVAVVPKGDYGSSHPSQALIVIEVADTSLLKDRGVKTALYATAGVPEFWLVNLAEQVIEIHRRPVAGRYEEVTRIDSTGSLTSDAFPTLRIMASEILR